MSTFPWHVVRCSQRRFYSPPAVTYQIPEKYRNTPFLANAPLFDYTHWYIHKAHEYCFGDLVDYLKRTEAGIGHNEAQEKVRNIVENLEPCSSLLEVNFPIKKDDGHNETVKGFRAMHCLNLYETPCLGGMRICTDLLKDHVRAFSVLSTYKHACIGLNMAGAHGGIKLSGEGYSVKEMKNVIEGYGRELTKKRFLGSAVDVIEPDMYCGSQEMVWIAQEFAKCTGQEEAVGMACTVGKPMSCGGVINYDKTLAEGLVFILNLFLNNTNILSKLDLEGGLSGKTYIIQGLGKVGCHVIKLLTEAGAKCVGVKECDGYIYEPKQIPIEELISYKEKHGTILEFNPKTSPGSSDVIYGEEADILVLAATHRSLNCFMAERVKAKIILEAAYAAVTPSAYLVLLGSGKMIVPDIFATSGASIASYFEYVKSLQRMPYNIVVSRLITDAVKKTKSLFVGDDEAIMKSIRETILRDAYEEILNNLDRYKLGLDVRTAAYINGINKIFRRIFDLQKY